MKKIILYLSCILIFFLLSIDLSYGQRKNKHIHKKEMKNEMFIVPIELYNVSKNILYLDSIFTLTDNFKIFIKNKNKINSNKHIIMNLKFIPKSDSIYYQDTLYIYMSDIDYPVCKILLEARKSTNEFYIIIPDDFKY